MKSTTVLTLCLLLLFSACKKDISANAISASNSSGMNVGATTGAMLISSGDKTVTFLDATTGKEIYFNQRLINNSGLMISQTPLVVGNICFLFLGSEVWAVNMQTQERIWRTVIGKTLAQYGWYRTSPACVTDSTIYFTSKRYGSNANVTNNDLIAINMRNGHILWQAVLPVFYDNDLPVQVPVCNSAYTYVAVYNTLYAYNRETGVPAWNVQRGLKFMRNPCIANNAIYVASDANVLYNDSLFAIDATSGNILWAHGYKSEYSFGYNPSPVVERGKLFVNMSNGVSCLEAATGIEIWQDTTDRQLLPLFFDKGILYASSPYNSYVYSINASDGSLNWETNVVYENGLSNLEEGPLVLNDLVYVRNEKYFALNKITGALVWSTQLHNGLYTNPPYTPNATNNNGMPVFYSASGIR